MLIKWEYKLKIVEKCCSSVWSECIPAQDFLTVNAKFEHIWKYFRPGRRQDIKTTTRAEWAFVTTNSLTKRFVKTLANEEFKKHFVCHLFSLQSPHLVDKGQELFSMLHK